MTLLRSAILLALALAFGAGLASAQVWQPKPGVDIVGNDYRSFSTAREDWKSCKAACEGDAECRAWSLFSPPGGSASYCWIKNLADEQRADPNAVSGLRESPIAPPRTSSPGKADKGYGRPGNDYHVSIAKRGDFAACQARCEADGPCRSWTFQDGAQKDHPSYCYLKNRPGALMPTERAWTGLRAGAPGPAPTAAEIAAKQARSQRFIEEVVELHRPVMAPRKLSGAEKNELKAVVKAYERVPTFAGLERLKALAQSGDAEAMKAMIVALEGFPPPDAPLESRNTGRSATVNEALRSLWAAHYWQLNGPDREIARLMQPCLISSPYFGFYRGVASFFDCGFDLESSVPAFELVLRAYVEKRGKAPQATVYFTPLHGGEAFQLARYDRIKKRIAQGQGSSYGEEDWIAYYSAQNDMRAQDQKWAEYAVAFRQAGIQNNQQRHNLYVSDLTTRWNRLFGKSDISTSDLNSLEYLSAALGGSHLDRFVQQYGLKTRFALDKLCKQDAVACAAQTPRVEQAQAAVAPVHSGGYTPAPQSSDSALLSVRTYDSGGNYTGTTSMTAWEAEILGVKPY